MTSFRTVYCGGRHRLNDGLPIGHACRVLDPAYLVAERDEDYWLAASLIQSMRLKLHPGLAAEDAFADVCIERARPVCRVKANGGAARATWAGRDALNRRW